MTPPPEATPNDLDAIVAELNTAKDRLPVQAIEAARRHREQITPRLLGLIEDAVRAAQQGRKEKTNGHFFALFLLAEFRARQALPVVLRALALPGEGPFDLFGDAITETLPSILLALGAAEHLDDLLALLDNPEVDQFVRWSTARVLAHMAAAGLRPRAEIMQLLRERLRRAIDLEDYELVTGLVNTLCDLAPTEAYEEIKEAYDKGLVETFMLQLRDVDEQIQRGQADGFKNLNERLKPLDDIVAELRRWASFSEPEKPRPAKALPVARPPYAEPKPQRVGRNDPCPCGSGKKFKKCCGSRL
jgi:uncharacterized protein YchJ